MKHYLAGYYLIQVQPIKFGPGINQCVLTCSTCINNSLLDSWSFSWAVTFKRELKATKKNFLIGEETISSIQVWADSHFDNEPKTIGWPNIFSTVQTAEVYYETYFSHLNDIKLLALYFNETEAEKLIKEFKSTAENESSIGLVDVLHQRIIEAQTDNEKFIGYDLIGIEVSGDFHTFHCHSAEVDLISRFKLTMNEYGLFEENDNLFSALDYMNDENNGFEPVPWFLVKVKQLTEVI